MQNNQDNMWTMMYPSYRSNSNNMSTMTTMPMDDCLDPTPIGPRSMIRVVDSVPLEHVSTLLAATSSTRTPTQLFPTHEEFESLLLPRLEMDNGHPKNNIHDFDVDEIDIDESFWKRPLSMIAMEDFGDDDDDDDDLEAFYQQINGFPTDSDATTLVAPPGDYWSFEGPAIDCAVTGLVVRTDSDTTALVDPPGDYWSFKRRASAISGLVVRPTQIPTMSSATGMVGQKSGDWSFRSPIVDCAMYHVKKDGLMTHRVSCDEGFCPSSISTLKTKSIGISPPYKKHKRPIKHSPPSAKNKSSTISVSSSPSSFSDASPCKLRGYQALLWKEKFQELCDFKVLHGTCHVPHDWSINPSLAKWVKRQRYQHKLKTEGKHTTLTDARKAALDDLGFVWQSHLSAWEEKYQELLAYQAKHGHCHVPSQSVGTSEHSQLAVWVQCQRRQYRLYCRGERSFMTEERVQKLERVGFVWRPRQAGGMTTATYKINSSSCSGYPIQS
jgi:Helicase associated domain